MSTKQIQIWYWILNAELLLAGLLFLCVSFFAEALGIDSGGDWGIYRILTALAGSVLEIISVLLWFPRVKTIAQTDRIIKFLRYATESVLWIFAILGLCELLLRITVSQSPSLIYEKEWGLVPVAGSLRFWAIEGYGTTRYLAHGEIATPFEGDGVSVVVLGDSNTESFQVSDDFKFVSLAERNIRSTGKAVDLHNLGRSGNSISDYIYLAPLIKQYYDPKIIVVQLSPQDFYGTGGGDSFNSTHRNYFVVNEMGDLELRHKNQQYASGLYGRLISRNMIYTLGRERYAKVAEKVKFKFTIDDQYQPVGTAAVKILPEAQLDKQLKLLQEAYAGTKIIALLLPYSPTIDKDRIIFDDGGNFELLKSSVAKNGNFLIIDPQCEFQDLVEQGYLPRGFINSVPSQGHMSKYGHSVIGELLANKILEIIH